MERPGMAPAQHAYQILPYDNFGHRLMQPYAVRMFQIEWETLVEAIC